MSNRSSSAQQRQKQIYLAGLAGKKPPVPVDMAELERRALRRMSRDAAAAIGGGAGREDTMQANREAFSRWQILPRMLRDVSALDTSIELFGQRRDQRHAATEARGGLVDRLFHPHQQLRQLPGLQRSWVRHATRLASPGAAVHGHADGAAAKSGNLGRGSSYSLVS